MSRTRRGTAFVMALIAVAVGGLSYVFGVANREGQRAEESVLGASDFTMDPPPPLGLVSIPAVLIIAVILAMIAWWASGIGRALVLLVVGAAAILASRLLKLHLIVRPELLEFDAPNTFPSGHMTLFAVLAGALIWSVPRSMRGLAAIAAAALTGTVAWQLLAYGWHRPSDVVGGLALGLLAFALGAMLWWPSRAARFASRRSAAGVNRVIGALLTVAGVVIVIGGLVLVFVAVRTGSDALMLSAGEISVVGASVLASRAIMAVSG